MVLQEIESFDSCQTEENGSVSGCKVLAANITDAPEHGFNVLAPMRTMVFPFLRTKTLSVKKGEQPMPAFKYFNL